eukprot:TRINITY_DN8582_c0_g1_i1.p1 TRINITY_DN8582_c0_g1~~TRINITY_DN8582_c0_g1_i1.p1  ORF type:complete len:550 (+),score=65.46 TRINITY_DN8582_c0_g1_i1:33-1652(+)
MTENMYLGCCGCGQLVIDAMYHPGCNVLFCRPCARNGTCRKCNGPIIVQPPDMHVLELLSRIPITCPCMNTFPSTQFPEHAKQCELGANYLEQRFNVDNTTEVVSQLENMKISDDNTIVHASPESGESLKSFRDMLASGKLQPVLHATQKLRSLLSIDGIPNIEGVIESGCAKYLVKYLLHKHDLIAYNCCWAVGNIASGNSKFSKYLVSLGVIDSLYKLCMQCRNRDIVSQCMWSFGNLSGDGEEIRDLIIFTGIHYQFLDILAYVSNRKSDFENTIWLMANLTRGKPRLSLNDSIVFINILEHLQELFFWDDSNIDFLWMCTYLIVRDAEIQLFLDCVNSSTMEQIMLLSTSENRAKAVPSLRILGNLLCGNDNHTLRIVRLGILNCFYTIMNGQLFHTKNSFRKELYWCLSNITTCCDATFAQHKIFALFIKCALSEDYSLAISESIYVVSNMCKLGNIKMLIENHLFQLLEKWIKLGFHSGLYEILGTLLSEEKNMIKAGENSIIEALLNTNIPELIQSVERFSALFDSYGVNRK